uniref:Uncharacterized protein n=1 Tax=Fagus sylvatica TaxID=28930 RepID=A0A2N9J9P5_FAGSY
MHLYNAWLPPPVAQETKREKDSFSRVVCSVKDSLKPDDPDSVYSTLKWISVIDLFFSIILILGTWNEAPGSCVGKFHIYGVGGVGITEYKEPPSLSEGVLEEGVGHPSICYNCRLCLGEHWRLAIGSSSFIKAKSDVSLEDVSTLVEIGLELFNNSQNKLYAQMGKYLSKGA